LQEPLQSPLRFRAALDRAIRNVNVVERADTVEECRLTPRERDVLALVATGTNAMIGNLLGAERTVRKHQTNTYAKLEVSGRTAAAMWWRNASDSWESGGATGGTLNRSGDPGR
jgi:DNA-binding NarL/FixJ family response regulator